MMNTLKSAAVCAAFLFAVAAGQAAPKFKKGDAAPSFRLHSLDNPAGQPVSLTKVLQSKKPVLFSYFATWCAPCIREIPILEAVKKTENVDIYLVSVDTVPAAEVKAWMKKWNFNLPVLLDPDGLRAGMRFGVVSNGGYVQVPQLFLLSPDKTVWWHHTGASEGLEADLRAQIQSLQADIAASKKLVQADPKSFWTVFTNSANGYLKPCNCPDQPFGGVTRRSTYFKELRESLAAGGEAALFLDAGDNFALRGESLEIWSSVFSKLAYDAAVLGDQEVTLGAGEVRKTLLGPGHPFLGANYAVVDAEKTESPPPYRVFKKGDLRVGVIAVMNPDIFALASKGWKKNVKVSDPAKNLAALIPKVRQEADVIVVLSHGGLDGDRTLAEQVPGIDLIVGGHSQSYMKEPLKVQNLKTLKNTWIVQAGQNGQYVGKVLVRLTDEHEIKLEGYSMVPLTDDIDDDPEIVALLPAQK